MAPFEHCRGRKPPERHPGCHSVCPYYLADVERHRSELAANAAASRQKDDFLTAREFKSRRLRSMRKK